MSQDKYIWEKGVISDQWRKNEFNKWDLGQVVIHVKKNKIKLDPTSLHKQESIPDGWKT